MTEIVVFAGFARIVNRPRLFNLKDGIAASLFPWTVGRLRYHVDAEQVLFRTELLSPCLALVAFNCRSVKAQAAFKTTLIVVVIFFEITVYGVMVIRRRTGHGHRQFRQVA